MKNEFFYNTDKDFECTIYKGAIFVQTLQQWAFQAKKTLVLLTLFALLLSLGVTMQAIGIVQIVQLIFIEQTSFQTIFPYVALLLGAIIIRLYANYMLTYFGGQLAEQVKNQLRADLLDNWLVAPFEQHTKTQTGHKVTLFIESVEALESYFREYVPQVIKSVIVPVAILTALFTVHSNSAWILLMTAPFIPLTYILIGLQTQAKSEQQLDEMNKFSGKFLDVLQGLQTIKFFGQLKVQQAELAKSNAGFMQTTLTVLKIAFASTLFIELITTLGIGLVALEIGFQMIVFKTLAFAPAFFVLTLAPEYYNSLKELGAAFHTGRGSLGAAMLIQNELNKKFQPVRWGQQQIGTKPSLSMVQAVFRYTDGPQIGPFSFRLEGGETLAIIGKTGHGKTTLLHMLSSFVSLNEGQLLINDTPQQDVDEQSWLNEMSYISQQPYVFTGSLRDNLCMGQRATDKEIFSALEKAQLAGWVKQLANGLDTRIGEAGRGLSGGEKQRIAIARAFLKKPSIVFFDEPTAGLDVKTEQALTSAMKQLSGQATTVIVAHRYESIAAADKILLVENGRLLAFGSHEALANYPHYIAMKNGGELHE